MIFRACSFRFFETFPSGDLPLFAGDFPLFGVEDLDVPEHSEG